MATGGIDPQAVRPVGAMDASRTGTSTSAGPSTANDGTGFSANINGLRGLCVAMVFLFHVASAGLAPLPAAHSSVQLLLAYALGAMAHGVEIFFMISGYVIVLSLRRHASVAGFLVDRCLRIFPLWMPMALAIALLWPWLGGRALPAPEASPWLALLVANLLLLPPLLAPFLPATLQIPSLHPASWSLTIEWLFYLVAAGLAVLAQASQLPPALRLPAGAVVVALAVWLVPVALCFVVGVGVALALSTPPTTQAAPTPQVHPGARVLQRWAALPGVAAASLLLFLLLWRSLDAAGLDNGARLPTLLALGQAPALLAALFAGTVCMAGLSAPGATAMPLLRTALLQRLGTISYSFYLWHLLVMFVTKRLTLRLWPEGGGTWAATLLFAAASLALSWWLASLSWRWVEQSFGRWLRQRLGLVRPRPAGLAV